MATKADFTPDEWQLLLQSPLLAGMAVTAADPSGVFGMLKESMAGARALAQAKADPNADRLLKEVAGAYETKEGRGLVQQGMSATVSGAKAPTEIVSKALNSLHQVSDLLDAKAGDNSGPFKTWLAGVAKSVAEASSEGGFLGFGGKQVSDTEKATVGQIAGALGVPTPLI